MKPVRLNLWFIWSKSENPMIVHLEELWERRQACSLEWGAPDIHISHLLPPSYPEPQTITVTHGQGFVPSEWNSVTCPFQPFHAQRMKTHQSPVGLISPPWSLPWFSQLEFSLPSRNLWKHIINTSCDIVIKVTLTIHGALTVSESRLGVEFSWKYRDDLSIVVNQEGLLPTEQ